MVLRAKALGSSGHPEVLPQLLAVEHCKEKRDQDMDKEFGKNEREVGIDFL